jgi:hypothetical protein
MTKISKKRISISINEFVGTDGENNGKTVNFDFEQT